MTITKSEAAFLGRQAARPVKAAGELLAIWVPGKLVNTKNARLHYMAESRYKRGWRERVALALLEQSWVSAPRIQGRLEWFNYLNGPAGVLASTPKRVAFVASTVKTMDTDGLAVALAPVRDSLIECGVISGDAPKDGHEFVYEQRIARARRGVELRISLREAGR